MTKLTRYQCAGYVSEMQQFDSGDWVRYTDVSFLEAELFACESENARLRAASFVTAVSDEAHEKLKSEVERLTKAGDEMAEIVKSFGFDQAQISWNKVKAGPK